MSQQSIDHIWYACYGSNLKEERFMCYISGGTPPGAVRNFKGCTDKTHPLASNNIIIHHELYFAKKSVTWNGGGICFLNPKHNENVETLGRRYLINISQFTDLVRQELKFEGEIEIDLEELIEYGSYNCFTDGRYGLLLYLGEIDGVPIVTFTSERLLYEEINPPNPNYLITIAGGLKEIYDINNQEIIDYLKFQKGIKDTELENKLDAILGSVD